MYQTRKSYQKNEISGNGIKSGNQKDSVCRYCSVWVGVGRLSNFKTIAAL